MGLDEFPDGPDEDELLEQQDEEDAVTLAEFEKGDQEAASEEERSIDSEEE
jgi:hypothetical protein